MRASSTPSRATVWSLLAAAGAAAGQGCLPLQNPSFDQDTLSDTHAPDYQYTLPSGWSGTPTGVVISRSGNRPWGGLNATASGGFYLVLQGRGASVYQSLSGLVVGRQYFVTFDSAERPGYMTTEKLSVSIDSNVIVPELDPFDASFFRHRVEFTATATSQTLNFTNVSPAGVDNSVFIDAVSVCAAPAGCVPVHNPDFEHDAHGTAYNYQPVTGWVSVAGYGLVVAANGNAPWGHLDSGNGAYYLVLQRSGSGVQQQIKGLTPGATYNMSFLAAERPGYGTNERMQAFVNNQPLIVGGTTLINPTATGFQTYWGTFVASASGRNLVSFENASPNSTEDRSVFLDAVQVCSVPGVPVNPHPGCVGWSQGSSGGKSGGKASSGASVAAGLLACAVVALVGYIAWSKRTAGSGAARSAAAYSGLSISADTKPAANLDDFDEDHELVSMDTVA